MIVVIVLIVYGAYLAAEMPTLLRAKKRNVIWPCLIILCIGAVVQVLHELKVAVPSPTPPIAAFVSGLFNIK